MLNNCTHPSSLNEDIVEGEEGPRDSFVGSHNRGARRNDIQCPSLILGPLLINMSKESREFFLFVCLIFDFF